MSHLPGKFIWFEHTSANPDGARAFYTALMGWSVHDMPMGEQTYHAFVNGEQAIGGLRTLDKGQRAHWATWMSCADVDASVAHAIQAGAQAVMPPFDFPGMGRGASVRDPQGALVYLWHANDGDAPDVKLAPVGGWIWNELMTSDLAAAKSFYCTAFGYSASSMSTPEGEYQILSASDEARGGIGQGEPIQWTPYLRVGSVDDTLALAVKAGATVKQPAFDLPGVGRIALLIDPFGVSLGLMQPPA